MEETQIKKISVSFEPVKPKKETKEKTVNIEKEKQKRQITTTKKWTFDETTLTPEYQWNLIDEIHKNNIINREHCDFVMREIYKKIYGYRSQDIEKKLLCEEKLVNIINVLDLMMDCKNKCYYCKENVNVLYEIVREPKQWTLERLDNSFGHNRDNVVIACLSCNVRRRTMYHERYVFTKQLNIVKKDGV
jgi:23S rRNA U2552 (ribose-2'-O)-methylase RlmE/FtsJ